MARSALVTARRRGFLIIAGVMAMILVFSFRLFDLQVVRADALVAAAHEKTTGVTRIQAHRGDIVDTNGEVLAESVTQFSLTTSPKDVADQKVRNADGTTTTVTVDEMLDSVAEITGTSASDMRDTIDAALEKDPASNYAVLATGLDSEQRLALPELGIPWLYYEQADKRVYPDGAVAGNVVGFRSGDNEESLAGVELMADSCLSGTNGQTSFQRTTDNVALPGTTQIDHEPVDGGTVTLTIDSDLNWYMQQLVSSQVEQTKAEYGIIVVTEAKTGKVRAIAESSAVDPNDFTATDSKYQGSLAFQGTFEPGSVFKALTAASLVDAGVADHSSRVVADYWYHAPNGANIKDALPHDPENLTLAGVLQQSSNTGLSQLGEKLSPEKRYEYLTKFGFGQPTAIGFPGEASGILRPVSEWTGQSYYTPMFGQGVSTSAMQVANAFQAVANDGVKLPLQLIEGCETADGETSMTTDDSDGERVISAAAAQETRKMMETVVTDGFLADDLTLPGYRVAAKSGTGEQFDEAGTLKTTFFASMAGMVPADDPEYVVTVHLKDPLTLLSSAAAAPVFKQAVTQVIKHYEIPPSTTPGSDYPGYWK
ncbi:peptidoglycan D,D-transpeptidase FtsI family protein [Mycetocola reblochoni]|uniref:Cell division protein FtsI [Peptidoglycan synthetase] n=2 Tax=Mycetocola reblochoni TaxID=331618 RepID=A0A1R4J6U7_9MICO|nr:penicillin-binding protein 2 [Mycetocola reblochoni]RLP69630.1 penicillin-binding protein 2 [Mycetocola reblochoni]SJN27787.1 Cell division protein FtsI [Peptidoglycan synthetase] [Mycetocola reblochoni REB411]